MSHTCCSGEWEFEFLKDPRTLGESFSLPAGGPILTSCVLASPKEKHRSSFRPSLPPSPTVRFRSPKGASLFVPESSRAFLIRPRTMHDEIRTGPPYGMRHRSHAIKVKAI